MSFSRMLTNLCSDRLGESRDFYLSLLGFGIIARTSELVPAGFRQGQTGMYVTFVVPDMDAVDARAKAMDLAIMQEPRNEFYGQRRFLTVDPNGCLIDVCSPWSVAEK